MTHVVADERILRQKFLLCVEELFGERSVEPTRETIERAPVLRDFGATTRVRDGHHLYRVGIRPETLADNRFLDTVRQTHDGTIVFPFRDLAGVTGLSLFALASSVPRVGWKPASGRRRSSPPTPRSYSWILPSKRWLISRRSDLRTPAT